MVDIATEVRPDLTDLIFRLIADAQAQSFGPILAEVESYVSLTQVCTATPLVVVVRDGEPTRLATMQCIPVIWPGGKKGGLTSPLVKGDIVELVPQMADITGWQTHGAIGGTPEDPRALQLSDIVAIPGGRSMASPLPPAAVSNLGPVLHRGDSPLVFLGSSLATDFVSLSSIVDANFAALKVYLDLLLVGTLPAVPNSPVPASVGSTKVRSE